jgi:hypothetical protein
LSLGRIPHATITDLPLVISSNPTDIILVFWTAK